MAAMCLFCGTARSQPHAIELGWNPPKGCPEKNEVLAEIERLLGGPPEPREAPFVAEARLSQRGGRWAVVLTTRDARGSGERTVEGASCAEVANATALVIAIAFDPERVAEVQRRESEPPVVAPQPAAPAEPPPAPAPPPPPPPQPARPPPSPRPIVEAPHERVWFSLAAGVSGDVGSLPSPAFGVGGAVAVSYHPVGGRVRAFYFLPSSETLPERPTAGGDFDLWAVAISFCLVPWRSAEPGTRELGDLHFELCPGLELGQMRGRGFGVSRPDEGAALWLGPRGDAALRVTLHRYVGLRAEIGALAPLARPEFVLENVGVVYRASAAVGRASLDVEVVF